MKSRVHPKYKTRYRVTNWREYEQGLVERGDVTIWLSPEAIDTFLGLGMPLSYVFLWPHQSDTGCRSEGG